MARRLNTRSSFISTFATHVSHELKSPLTSIKGAAELLREDVDAPDMDDADRRKFLDNIIADADRLGTIAGRLRDFARAENPVALGAAKLSVAVAGLRSAFPALDIRADGDLDTPMRVSEDNVLIIFSNLADNAVRHGSSSLDVSASRQGNQLKVTVSDDGEGVSPNNRTQIFDSFFTTRRDSGGTGMGLAIVRAMLDAHGGAVRLVESDRGHSLRADIPRGRRRSRLMPGASIGFDLQARKSRIIVRAGLCLAVIACGLALRGWGFGLGLSAFVVKYGGSVLWGTMVFLLAATAASHFSRHAHRGDHDGDRHRRRDVPAGAFPVAGRLSANAAGRAAARADLLDVEHAGLWRRHCDRRVAGSIGAVRHQAQDLASAARHYLPRFALRAFLVAFLTTLFPAILLALFEAFFAAFLAVVLEAFFAPSWLPSWLLSWLPSWLFSCSHDFFAAFPRDFATLFHCLPFRCLGLRLAGRPLRCRALALAGWRHGDRRHIKGSETKPSAASGM